MGGIVQAGPLAFSWFGNLLAERYSHVLIDSAGTGVTDTAGICTAIIPVEIGVSFLRRTARVLKVHWNREPLLRVTENVRMTFDH